MMLYCLSLLYSIFYILYTKIDLRLTPYSHNLDCCRSRIITRKKVRVTVMAENILTTMPIASVKAKPLTTLVPNHDKITQVIREETLESRIDVQARSKPACIACGKDFSRRYSSFKRSNIRILVSTAMPNDKMNPAMPARVKVTGQSLKIAKTNAAYIKRATTAIIQIGRASCRERV